MLSSSLRVILVLFIRAYLMPVRGGEVQDHGSGDLMPTRLRRRLFDSLRTWQFPVVVGTGKRLFGEGVIPCSFRLVDTQQATTGAVLNLYERSGDLDFGDSEVDQETVIFDRDSDQR